MSINFKDLLEKKNKTEEDLKIEKLPEIWDEYCHKGYQHFLSLKCFKKAWAVIEKMLVPCDGGVVLDGGCGTGAMFKPIIEKMRPKKILAVDFSEKMLEGAKETAAKLGKKDLFEFQRVDLAKPFPWQDNTFDAEIFNLSICYLPSPPSWRHAIKEAYRTLKPQAWICISTPVKGWNLAKGIKKHIPQEFLANPLACLRAAKVSKTAQKIEKYVEEGFIEYPSLGEFLNLLKELGFVNMEKERVLVDSSIVIKAQKSIKE